MTHQRRSPAARNPGPASERIRPAPTRSGVWDYAAFGLNLRSEVVLPELVHAQFDEPEIEIVLGREAPAPSGVHVEAQGDACRISWEGVGSFEVEARRVRVHPVPGLGDAMLSLTLLSPIMAVVLHLRGCLVLHGSVVAVEQGCIVFVGDSRAGKSVMAAAMRAEGCSLVADDLACFDLNQSGPIIRAGFPQIKLMPDAALLMPQPGSIALTPPGGDHRHTRERLPGPFAQLPLPPRVIYVLNRTDRAGCESLAAQRGLAAIMRHTFVARFSDELLTGVRARTHFQQCAKLVSATPVRRLDVPRDLTNIGQAIDVVRADLRL